MLVVPQDIDITNKEILNSLNEMKEEFFRLENDQGLRFADDANIGQYSSERAKTDPEYFLSDEYLQYVKDKGDKHRGPPEEFNAWPISRLAVANPEWNDLMKKVKNELAMEHAASHSSLASYYPPKGFVGWHTNWNNSNYQILFTWSETGDSYFLYKDPKTKVICKIQERPGWQAHLVYFGSKKEPEYVFWHAAYTNCRRFAWALSWDNDYRGSEKDKQAQLLVQMCMEELSDD